MGMFAIVLVDSRFLLCKECNTDLSMDVLYCCISNDDFTGMRTCHSCVVCFDVIVGHYILLCDYDNKEDSFTYCDPAKYTGASRVLWCYKHV